MNPHIIRILGWTIPFAAFAVALFAVNQQYSKLQEVKAESAQVAKQLQAQEGERELLSRVAKPQIQTAVPESEDEEKRFVQMLKSIASQSATNIDRLAPGKPVDEKTPGTRAIASQVELSGQYLSLRNFVSTLRKSPTLFVLSDAVWREEKGATSLKLTLTRYILTKSG